MSASAPEPSIHPACTVARAPRTAPSLVGRLRLGFRTALIAAQVACMTLIGWIGATLTLLPLAVRGAPVGRSVWPERASVIRLLRTAPPREAVPR